MTGGVSAGAAELADRWKRHEFLNGLYRFYLEKIISSHTIYLGLVGGLVVYVLQHPSKLIALGLLVPLVVSSGAALILYSATRESVELNAAIIESAGK
jgi:hypothetical protein